MCQYESCGSLKCTEKRHDMRVVHVKNIFPKEILKHN